MKINKLLPISFLAIPLLFSFAQADCTKTVQYQFTNNFNKPVVLKKVADENEITSIQNIVLSQETGKVTVCKITTKEPSITISDGQAIAQRRVNYRFMFRPMANTKFTGDPYDNVAFSWSSDNLHIFLCSSEDYTKHGTCNF